MKNRLDDLFLFRRLAETKSFTAVAEQVEYSRSLVSKRITALEDRMGVQLINRTTRLLELTEAGRTLHRYVINIENLLDQAETAVSDIRTQPHGPLNINAPVSFGVLILPQLITSFLQEYPDVNINLTLSDNYVNIIEGGYDVVLRIGQLKDSTFRARKIGSTRLKVCAHKKYLEKYGTPKVPQDLENHNCLIYKHSTGDSNEWHFDGPLGREVVQVSGNFNAENGIPMFAAAQAGLGIVTQPDFVIERTKDDNIVYILEDYLRSEIDISAVYPTARIPPLNTRIFIDYLASQMTKNST